MAELEPLVDAEDSAAAVVDAEIVPVDAAFAPEAGAAEASGLARTAEVAATAVTRAR
jgi:hypothetical protein